MWGGYGITEQLPTPTVSGLVVETVPMIEERRGTLLSDALE